MEKVNHPTHYQQSGKKECIFQMIDDFGRPAVVFFCLTNAYKYLYRAGSKHGSPEEEDIAKARWYFNFVNQHLYSDVLGKSRVALYVWVKKELAKHD